MGFFSNNKEIKKLHEELAEANRKLKEYEEKAAAATEASKMKSLFLANMSHEIRTPLNAVIGFSRILAEIESAEDKARYVQIVESSGNRLQQLVDEVLDLSRVERGEITLANEDIDVEAMLRESISVFIFRCPEEVKMIFDEPAEKNLYIQADKSRILQVLSNFMGNALKHTNAGTINTGYTVSADRKTISFYVSDTGEGMTPEVAEHIFELYYTKDANRKDEKKGFGLGLPLSRMIAEKMNGSITVDTELGKGSTFTLNIPLDEISKSSPETIVTSNDVNAEAPAEAKRSGVILVAEDSDTNYELVKVVLSKQYQLVRAHDGVEAVQLHEEHHPSMILMDIMMPNMDGLDATRIIKEVDPTIPIVALSAYAFAPDVQRAYDAGCDDFLTKPFRIDKLREQVEKYMK